MLGGGFKYFWNFHPYLGKIPILTNIFQMGWFNHQLVWVLCIFHFLERLLLFGVHSVRWCFETPSRLINPFLKPPNGQVCKPSSPLVLLCVLLLVFFSSAEVQHVSRPMILNCIPTSSWISVRLWLQISPCFTWFQDVHHWIPHASPSSYLPSQNVTELRVFWFPQFSNINSGRGWTYALRT